MSELTLSDFLSKTGGTEFILACEFSEKGRKFGEIDEELVCASSTVSERKKEAQDLGIIELVTERFESEHANTRRYKLTEGGLAIKIALTAMNIPDSYVKFARGKIEFEEGRKGAVEWVQKHQQKLDAADSIRELERTDILRMIDQDDSIPDITSLSRDEEPVLGKGDLHTSPSQEE